MGKTGEAFSRGMGYFARKCIIKMLKTPAAVRRRKFASDCARKRDDERLGSVTDGQPSVVGRPILVGNDPELGSACAQISDRFLEGQLLLFGEEAHFDKDNLPWHEDFVHGVHYEDFLYLNMKRPGSEDIKVPWEFGRLHILVHLALAYRTTRIVPYLDELKRLILDFYENNKVGYGVQWVCTMEVGIRIFNVLQAYSLVHEYLGESDPIHGVVWEMAKEHGGYIYANLETDARMFENNHYWANLLGLAAVSSVLPGIESCRSWGGYAHKELERLAATQILEDGMGFEGSSRYSRLVWEMAASAGLCFELNGAPMSEQYWQRISSAAECLAWLTAPSGRSPQIGDNDSGRVLFASKRSYGDLSYPRAAISEEGLDKLPDAFFFASIPQGGGSSGAMQGFRLFELGRICIYRSDDLYLCFCATDAHRFDVPGHSHSDKLSLFLEYRGREFIVDPGTGSYTYDKALRDRMRSVRSHSTIEVNDAEQNEFTAVFSSKYDGVTKMIGTETESGFTAQGVHTCYKSRFGVTHTRQVTFNAVSRKLVIGDSLGGFNPERCSAKLRYVLAPEVIAVLNGNTVKLKNDGVEICVLFDGCTNLRLEDGTYSREYSIVRGTKILVGEVVSPFVNTTFRFED